MPTYEIFVDGKPVRTEVTKTGEGSFTVKTASKSHNVELATDKIGLSKEFCVAIDGKTYRIELPAFELQRIMHIKIEEATFKVEVKTPSRKQPTSDFEHAPSTPTKARSSNNQAAREGLITAPMTGKIVQVKAKKGDQVKANQVLCIIEAMKMENEITAPKAGTVQEVSVSEGSSVSEGDALFLIG